MSRILCLLLVASAARAAGPAVPWSFERHVRPVLKAHCLECHGEGAKPKGGLDLRLRRLAVAGGAVVPGKPDESALVQHVRDGKMPPGKVKLSAREIDVLRGWIAAGAPARPEPAKLPPGVHFTDEDRTHWSFRPIVRPAVPAGAGNAIDRFLLDRLRRGNLAFAPRADRYAQLRRLSFALLGLPPTPEEIDAFLGDERPDAYERLVDRLLASPHYGERWARHWLDVAGYADSNGYTGADPVRRHAWKYRDWVVHALNADLPLDRFVTAQLAGDELPVPDLVATGFLRTAPDGTASPGANVREAANQHVADTVQIVSTALLGMTMQCAQCHNHRYDPVSQRDYYALRAVFEPALDPSAWRVPDARRISLMTPAQREAAARIEKEAVKLDDARKAKEAAHIARVFLLQLAKVPEKERDAVQVAFNARKRTPAHADLLRRFPFANVSSGSLYLYDGKAAKELKGMADDAAKLRATKPPEDFLDALTEIPGKVPATRVFHRGDFGQPGEAVGPASPAILGLPAIAAKDASRPTTGRRLAFARQLVDGKHPLTARVLANRVWLNHFGRGIVNTPGDFGALGDRPTHPELLDWLASELMDGWSLKRLHRRIVTSDAFRQGWRDSAEGRRIDPDNALLWRAPLRRLEAESVRDAMLAVSGRLVARIGGSPIPVMPDEAGRIVLGSDRRDAAGYMTVAAVDLRDNIYRRSAYIQARRSMPHSVLEAFDLPSTAPCSDRRTSSTAPQQALLLLNSRFIAERSRELAARLASEPNLDSQLRRAWLLAHGRPADADDIAGALAFVQRNGKQGLELLAQALLSSNAFLYVD